MAIAETELFFGDASPLHKAEQFGGPKYEVRPQQVEMALACAAAFDGGTRLCIEAPTGIGKTFAYLVPAYYHAAATGRPVIISTNTINLQEQIIHKDAPLLSKLINREIDCRIAKGRNNYLCLYRLRQRQKDNATTPPLPGTPEDRLFSWADETEDGDRNELCVPGLNAIWGAVNCSRDNCVGAAICPMKRECFMQRARNALKTAQIIVANHAFLFSALTCDDLLPPFSGLVLDEAHTMPEIAAAALGIHVNFEDISRHLRKIASEGGSDGCLNDRASAEITDIARALYTCLGDYTPKMVEYIRQNATGQQEKTLRITARDEAGMQIAVPLRDLGERIDTLARQYENKNPERAKTLEAAAAKLLDFADDLEKFFSAAEPDWAYWLELAGRNGMDVSCNAEPVAPARLLHPMLFEENDELPVIITSATLAVNGNLSYFKHRIGADTAEERILTTPFDYAQQVTLFMPEMPDPADGKAYSEAMIRQIRHFLEFTDGHAFVLFTSYTMLQQTAGSLGAFLKKHGFPLFIQGGDLTARQMLQAFRQSDRAVLFGTDSFWTGVDVPGDTLSNVIITKLPFQTPGHPLQQKRDELCRAINHSSFRDYTLPEAVLKFRQGFGRLIRTRSDKGIIVLLDNRLTSKPYGTVFLNSIPVCRRG